MARDSTNRRMNYEHRHSRIGCYTAPSVHFSTAEQVHDQRVVTLAAANSEPSARCGLLVRSHDGGRYRRRRGQCRALRIECGEVPKLWFHVAVCADEAMGGSRR